MPGIRATCALLTLLLLLNPPAAAAQLQVATLHGVVINAQGEPVAGATVRLRDAGGHAIGSATSNADGSFHIDDVAPGSYVTQVTLGGTVLLTRPLVVRGSLPVELTLQTGPTVHENVVVRGDAGSNTAEHPWSLAGEAVRRVSEPIPSQRVQSALASLPGWMVEDNGLLHIRGVDDGLLYVQDGIPIYERLDRLFGLPPSSAAIASLHVMNGYIPPEFGFKAGGVVEVRSETGLRGPWSGSLDMGLADFETRSLEGVAAGYLGRSGGLMVTGSDERSSRFLDPSDPANFHNRGRASSATGQLTWRAGPDLFTASVQGGRTQYDVPHGVEQERAGQDERQRTTQVLVSGTWQRVVSDRTVWQVSAYRRNGSAALFDSPSDTPVTAEARRIDNRFGALWGLTHQRDRHTLKVGGELSTLVLDEHFSFAVTEPDAGDGFDLSPAAIAHDPQHPFVFADRRRPSLWSGYAQDSVQASGRVTLNFGVRFDRSRMLLPASHWGPRIGASYRVRSGTTVRASVQRLFQPPQAEYLLLASSAAARALSPFATDDGGGGGAGIPPERQTALEMSLSQDLRPGWRVDAAAWTRHARDVDDPNVFFGTTVTVPNSVSRQQAWGFDLHLEMRPRRGWSASASYTHARVVQFGPITGGLFLEQNVLDIQDGTRFTPDHDQRHGLFTTASYADESHGWRLAGVFRYQTGTPIGVDDDRLAQLQSRRGSEVADISTGRVRPRAVADFQGEWAFHRGRRVDLTVTCWLNNVTNQTYAFNFGNAFSGTHFGAPRRVGLTLGAGFRRVRP